MCNTEGCKLSTYKNNKCILHSDDKNKNIKNFWNEIKNIIDKTNESYKKNKELTEEINAEYNYEMFKYKFENIIFPESIFEEIEYKSFYDLDKDLNIYFKNSTFEGSIDFSLLSNAKAISFDNCTFNCDIEFCEQKFQDSFLFEKCTVNSNLKFKNIIFLGVTSFIETKFNKKVEFIHSRSEDLFLFNSTKIEEIFIDNTFFNSESNFLDMKNKDEKDLKAENIKNRETARIIKNSFEKQDNIIEANKFYALEMEKREEELYLGKYFFEWSVFKFHKISSNHSQDWFLVLLWILNISYIYSFIKANTFYYIDTLIGFTFILFIFIFSYSFLIKFKNNLGKIGLSILSLLWLIYSPIKIDEVTNLISPFSIMTKGENLTFISLLYKIIIAYLIYQFIISIRQNTRRK